MSARLLEVMQFRVYGRVGWHFEKNYYYICKKNRIGNKRFEAKNRRNIQMEN